MIKWQKKLGRYLTKDLFTYSMKSSKSKLKIRADKRPNRRKRWSKYMEPRKSNYQDKGNRNTTLEKQRENVEPSW